MDAFVKKIEKYINEHNMLHRGDTVVMGVSGGADSVAMLLTIWELADLYELKLKVVHVNHGLRPEAVKEAEYVRSLCNERDIDFYLKECNVAELAAEAGLGTEEMGRNLRYSLFRETLGKDRGVIAVAHNMNDRAETMLFNLARGTGAKGLASILPNHDGLIRPLLCVTREEIEAYLNSADILFYTDSSNLTDEYTRNRIRNNILPLFREQISGLAVEHMSETADQLYELDEFAREYAEDILKSIIRDQDADRVAVDRNVFLSQKPYIRKVMVKQIIDLLVPHNKDITHAHLESVDYIAAAEGNHKVDIPYGISFSTSYDSLVAKRGSAEEVKAVAEAYLLREEGETDAGSLGRFRCNIDEIGKSFDISKEKYTKCFDYDKVKKALSIRTRLKGDELSINSEGGTKKLNRFFIDEKIPEADRDRIPVIADGNDIVWVVGYRISEAYKVTESTRKILTITYITEEQL